MSRVSKKNFRWSIGKFRHKDVKEFSFVHKPLRDLVAKLLTKAFPGPSFMKSETPGVSRTVLMVS